ncbi:MAG: NADH:flavin oxidoreductase [Lachnospiraceae bacterium]|nr:NADH:flavin oxidoreductase [Lachnospiraceae bacterium]MBQ8982282.1 NADH:flavin oxidoreductase [Lachnospiraceae bacterium]
MKRIFEPVKMNYIELSNRLVRSATWEGIANPDGSVTEEAYDIYAELAKGGVGAIITGFTSVALTDYYFDGMMRLCDDALIPQYKELVDIIHAEGTPVITQLALGAYYREKNGRYLQVEPDDMTTEEIKYVIRQFIDAAIRAMKAGFDGVQIHAAHFFFLSRFLSPAVNHRTDSYGGSTENRSRILLKIMEGIRKEAPSLHITVKINSNDFTYDGLNESESLTICKLLDVAGIDSIEVSGNGTSVGGIRPHMNEGYFAPFAAKVAEKVSCPIIVVGGFRSLDTMENVLNETKIAMISLSRPLLREPDLPNKMKADSSVISKCVSCNACYSSPSHKCIFRGSTHHA